MVITIIGQLAFSRSHHANYLQQAFSLFFKADGLSSKANTLLNHLSITMSNTWQNELVDVLSDRQMERVRGVILHSPIFVSADNVNIPFRVFSQRLHHKSSFQSGTAVTAYPMPGVKPFDGKEFREKARTAGNLEYEDLIDIESGRRIHAQKVYHVLRFLIDSPYFQDYPYRKHKEFDPPPPVRLIPAASGKPTEIWPLQTMHIDQASLEGNSEWLDNVLRRQLRFTSQEAKKRLANEIVLPIVGDELTASRIQTLMRYRAKDDNGLARMEYGAVVPGFFHVFITCGIMVFQNHGGTKRGRGINRDITLLQRLRGKGGEGKSRWHDLKEVIEHTLEARCLRQWIKYSGGTSLDDLRRWEPQPEELRKAAEEIVLEWASENVAGTGKPLAEKNSVMRTRNETLLLRDCLIFHELLAAAKCGDVGRLVDLVPILAQMFKAGGHAKYAVVMLEFAQHLKKEWPNNVRDAILDYCLLVNTSGKPNACYPTDEAQEITNGDIKNTYAAQGPNCTWEYLSKISPVIPLFREVKKMMEKNFPCVITTKQHSVPNRDDDIAALVRAY
ncbi:hypothetical protein M407DRAFT_71589, partial [Tulasnella calospora MUT 4182]